MYVIIIPYNSLIFVTALNATKVKQVYQFLNFTKTWDCGNDFSSLPIESTDHLQLQIIKHVQRMTLVCINLWIEKNRTSIFMIGADIV